MLSKRKARGVCAVACFVLVSSHAAGQAAANDEGSGRPGAASAGTRWEPPGYFSLRPNNCRMVRC